MAASFDELEITELRVRLGEARAERDEFRRRLQEETDAHKRTLSLQDDEVAEFNAGYEAAVNGVPLECEPDDLPFDVWTHGWKSADHKRLSAEAADLRRQLAECRAAASPALIEEYVQACCHDIGVYGFVTTDWPQWLSRRAKTTEVKP